ncbi:ABC transporter ATP-binding protein [Micromonospora siamensis]|uniref:Putative ABC transport system ATP-binding protein n=1 Tax=Micromonospora siamensis TaxID=299152 RepID=A0A1C5JY99_9ACTN|nr:ABC transporter ATP-binding protein [Micromonospora siamensis]SCG75006.1 putative ABC transport system ATP-binding protein [Micromonospora siamensis]
MAVDAEGAGATAGAAIRISGLGRSFGAGDARIAAVRDLSLEIASGAVVALCGPSGSGKSTLLHLLAGIERPDCGQLVVDGVDLARAGRRALLDHRRRVGLVFQRFHLLPALSVLDNVLVPVVPLRVPFDKVARARQLLDAVGLAGRESATPAQLSGGQQQRVAIARALIGDPTLIVADEPTGSLDSATGVEILGLLRRVGRERSATMVVATHDRDVAESCDYVISMRDGRLTSDGAALPA